MVRVESRGGRDILIPRSEGKVRDQDGERRRFFVIRGVTDGFNIFLLFNY